jgi:hypothetical protein
MSKEKLSVMSYEDAVKMVELSEKEIRSDAAFVKLCRIIKALNNGWTPDFANWDQNKYWIYSNYLYSVSFGGTANIGARAGFGCANANYAPSFAFASFGSRLCLKDREAAEFVIENFSDLLKDLYMVEQ